MSTDRVVVAKVQGNRWLIECESCPLKEGLQAAGKLPVACLIGTFHEGKSVALRQCLHYEHDSERLVDPDAEEPEMQLQCNWRKPS